MKRVELILRLTKLYMTEILDGLRREAEEEWNDAVEHDDPAQEECYAYLSGVNDAIETARFSIEEMLKAASGGEGLRSFGSAGGSGCGSAERGKQ